MSKPFDLMAYADEEVQSSGGGNGYITEVDVTPGWFVFTGGPPQDRFWAFLGEEESTAGKDAANEYIDKHDVKNSKGARAKPFVAFRVLLYADSVLNRDETPTWQDGTRKFHMVGFGAAYQGELQEDKKTRKGGFKLSFEPYLASLGDKGYKGEKFWAQVGFGLDPDNPEWKNDDGEVQQNFVPYIAQTFDSEQQARAAIDSDAVAFPAQPEKWNESRGGNWIDYAQSIYDAAKDGGDPSVFKSKKDGVTNKVIQQIVNLREEEEIPF